MINVAQMETSSQRKERKEKESLVDLALRQKFDLNIKQSDDIGACELVTKKDFDEPIFSGGKEYDIILDSIGFLRRSIEKIDNANGGGDIFVGAQSSTVDISAADKSQLIVMVYKEWRSEREKNQKLQEQVRELMCQLDEKERSNNLKKNKIELLMKENASLTEKFTQISNKFIKLKRVLRKEKKKWEERSIMVTQEIARLDKEKLQLKDELERMVGMNEGGILSEFPPILDESMKSESKKQETQVILFW